MTSYFGFARSSKERRGLPINNVTLTLVQLYDVSKYDAHTPSANERKKELNAKVWPANLCHWNLSSLVDTSMGCKNKVRTDLNLTFAADSAVRSKKAHSKDGQKCAFDSCLFLIFSFLLLLLSFNVQLQ